MKMPTKQSQSGRNTRNTRGFTLIELLVVIAIIATLASMSFAGVNAALKRARRMEAQTAAYALVTAIENFMSEYNRLPNVGGSGPGGIQTNAGGAQLLRILLGDQNEQTENPRMIRFLNAKEARGTGSRAKGGLIYPSKTSAEVTGMNDPFGQPYTVFLNTNYDDNFTFTAGGKSYTLRGKNAAVWSPGPDGDAGTVDDITTFER